MRLIDADALLKELERRGVLSESIQYVIQKHPSVGAVKPVRHGMWNHTGRCRVDLDAPDEVWECSECHFTYDYEPEDIYNYCPNCGAKMDLEESI